MAEELRLALLGELQITRGGAPLSGFVSNKAQALLCYLAVTGRMYQRPALAGLLWGHMPEDKASASLRVALSNLRKLVGPHLLTTRQTAALDRERPYWLDVQALQSGAANGGCEQLSAAVELYRGDFMAGFYVHDAPAFEKWVLGQRERLRTLVSRALHSLVTHHIARGEYEASIDFAARTLALEPWREEAHRQMMLLLARAGQRSAALAQYKTCRRFLAQELEVEPSPETAALYERVKASALARPHNLPPEPTPFIGREEELAAISRRLADPGCRLLTVVGVGGIGKSRLAIQTARLAAEQVRMFLHGVTFVPLAGVESADLLVSAIANALNFSFHGRKSPERQLLNYLREKEMLLLLDNYEHLLPETTLLVDILRQAPDVKLMATSRERLNLREEWLFDVEGLLCPANDTTFLGRGSLRQHPVGLDDDGEIERLRTFDALRLFEASARRVQWRFSIAEERQAVVQICRLLQGLPLAIELSAEWLKTLSCNQIVQGIERSLDFLATSLHNVSPRHRSMRAVFEHSWQLLSETERGVLRELSVFRGGFTREAAREVAGASLPVLASLVDKSLLRLSPSGRYELHELLRQYAADKLRRAEKLATMPQARDAARDRHCEYYAAFIKRQEPDLGGARAVEALAAIETEIENVRAAWRWAVAQARIKEINHSLEGLSRYYLLVGPFRQGEMIIEMGVDRINPLVDKADGPGQEVQIIQAKLRVEQARFLNRQGMYDRAIAAAQAAIDLALPAIESSQAVSLEAAGYLHWGQALFRQGKYEAAQTQLEQALDRVAQSRRAWQDLDARSTDALPLRQRPGWSELAQVLLIQASSLRNLGSVFLMQSDYDKSRGYYERALRVYREVGDRRGESATLNNLGIVSRSQGDYAGAKVSYEQALSIKCEIGDRWGEGVTLNGLGLVSADQGDYAEARTSLERALSIFRDMGDRQSVGHTLNDLGLVSLYLGDYARGKTCQEQALAILCEVGDRRGECTALADLGLLFHHVGDDQAARECSQKALLIAKELGVRSSQGYASTRLGHALLGLGQTEKAQAAYQNALVLRQELDQPNQAAEVRSGLARVFLEQGRQAQAQAQVEKILSYLEGYTSATGSGHGLDGTFEPLRVYLTCYCVLRARRDPRAQSVLHTAHCLLVEQAAKISDEELRRSFLENVAAHREIVKSSRDCAESLRVSCS